MFIEEVHDEVDDKDEREMPAAKRSRIEKVVCLSARYTLFTIA